jgi:hypothetical protein
MRATVHGAACEHGLGPRRRAQTDPAPAATLKGCGTGMRIPIEGAPLDVVAGGWPCTQPLPPQGPGGGAAHARTYISASRSQAAAAA